MSCPTCSHTLGPCGDQAAREMWHCPRCGTLRIRSWNGNAWLINDYVPRLVERCQEIQKEVILDLKIWCHWNRLGIREAINLPENRS